MKHLSFSRYRKIVLVCTNEREDRECCKRSGSDEFYEALKTRMKSEVRHVRVVSTKCLGHCLKGPTVVIMPDNVWLGEVGMEDIDEIVDRCRSLVVS